MDWLRKLSEEELLKVLEGDAQIVYLSCGLDTLINLYKNLAGINIYLSNKSIRNAQKLYICRNFNGVNHKELAMELGVSERYIYYILGER